MLTRLASPDAAARWLRTQVSGTLRSDSRQLQPGDGFIAWPGHATDGRRFVGGALADGAAAVLVESVGIDAYGFDDPRIGALRDLKAMAGQVADRYFGQPSAQLRVLAVTGTNGKTSTAWWLAQALTGLGRRCGLVGTLGIGEPLGTLESTGLTTPDPVTLHAAFRRMADAGWAACAIEASSIGLAEHRLAATRVAVALFTNFTRDHLDYHGDMGSYWEAKRSLFDVAELGAAVINVDDAKGEALAESLGQRSLDLWTYRVGPGAARLRALDVRYADGGLAFTVQEDVQAGAGVRIDAQAATQADAQAGAPTAEAEIRSTLIGDYNVANLLAVIGGLRALGVSLADAVSVVPALTPVPGRLQRIAPMPDAAVAESPADPASQGARAGSDRGPEVIVDYAHTPDALDKALAALRPLAAARGGRLVCLFGCGGNRDASKRPLMAAAAERGADHVVVTSDNPRHEPPAAILEAIVAGFTRPAEVRVIEDRRAAIAAVIAEAAARDVVLVAGKGHEDYQETAGRREPFSDVDESARALADWKVSA